MLSGLHTSDDVILFFTIVDLTINIRNKTLVKYPDSIQSIQINQGIFQLLLLLLLLLRMNVIATL